MENTREDRKPKKYWRRQESALTFFYLDGASFLLNNRQQAAPFWFPLQKNSVHKNS